jgi:hypothetical protein
MIIRRVLATLAVAAGIMAGTGSLARAQEPAVPKDEALDSLLEKLSEPSQRADQKSPKSAPAKKDDRSAKKSEPAAKDKKADSGKPEAGRLGSGSGQTGAKDGKAPPSKPDGAGNLAGKDEEVDELLKKLGETTETPSPDERSRGGAPGGEKADGSKPSGKPDPTDRSKLTGKDKETDEHLEELTGRKKKKKGDDGERTGEAGQLIKEMRDVEQKLGKPDTGDATREQQKKVVKHIETLIEEMKRSGQSSMGRMRVRMVRKPGQQQPGGRQQDSTDGAMARGAPLQKPLKPTNKHSNAGGKEEWGHLPPEMRAEMENMWNEQPLSTKQELIDRYYLSVGKSKLVREVTP